MVTPRPVDNWPKPKAFLHDRLTALRLGCCLRCGRDVPPYELSDIDEREYGISAMCPLCFFEVTEAA